MRRVLGVAAVIAIVNYAGLAAAQDSWGTPPAGGNTGEQGGGWGQTGDTGTTTTPPPEQGSTSSGDGWSGSSQQASDTESPTTGGGASGWGSPASQPATSQPRPTSQPTTTTTTTSEPEERGPVGSAFRLQHRAALGAHNHMSGAFLAAHDGVAGDILNSQTPWLNLSFMYHINRILTIDIFMGFTIGSVSYAEDDDDTVGNHAAGDKATSFELGFATRLLITLAEGDHARLYTGFGMALLIGLLNGKRGDVDDSQCPDVDGCGGWDGYGFAMAAPLGVEYRFRRVPNLAFSAELNFHFVFQSVGLRYEDDPADSTDVISEAEYNHIVVGMGNARNGGHNFIDFLSFLTMGFHWMI